MANARCRTICLTPIWNKNREGVGLENLLLAERVADSIVLAFDERHSPFRLTYRLTWDESWQLRDAEPLVTVLDTFERIITRVLLAMMTAVVLLFTVELVWIPGRNVLSPPLFLLNLDESLELFGLFLLVMIGIELLHTMKIYITQRVIHLEAMLIVALIAVTRKIVVLEPKELPEGTALGIAASVFALTLGYYLTRRSRREKGDPDPESKG